MTPRERFFIYLAYGFVISLAVIFVARASAWELKTEYKTPLTPVCRDCLVAFASCNEAVDQYNDKSEDVDPQVYINEKLSCVARAARCTEDNKCGTKVVFDKTP